MSMLDRVAPELSARLRALSPEARRRVITDVCLLMSRRLEEIEPTLRSLIAAAAKQYSLSREERAAVRRCAETADDRYLELLSNERAKAECHRWFVNARVATALAAAFASSDQEAVADAAYELSVVDEEATALGLIESAIDRLRDPGASSFSMDIRRNGRVATLTYKEAGHTLEIGLEASGVRDYDYVGVNSAFVTWTVPPRAPISEHQRGVIRRRIDEWASSRKLRLGFGPVGDLNAILDRFTSAGLTVTGGTDVQGRRTLTVERPPVHGPASAVASLWMRVRRWMGF